MFPAVTDAAEPASIDEPVAIQEKEKPAAGQEPAASAADEEAFAPAERAAPGSAEEPAASDDDDDDEPGGEPVPSRGRGRLALIAAAVLLGSIVTGGGAAWWLLHPDPRGVAEDYFARLAAGDAFGALRDVDKSSIAAELPTADLLLSDAALVDPASRPQHMKVIHVAQSGGRATITVQYQANGATVTQTLDAQRRGRQYQLENPLVKLSFTNLSDAEKLKVKVNGVAVDPAKNGPAFPGAYAVTTPANELFDGRSVTVVPAADDVAVITLPAPTMSADARPKADAAINTALQTCFGAASPQFVAVFGTPGTPTSCPALPGTFASIDMIGDLPLEALEGMRMTPGRMVATSGATLTITKLPTFAYASGAGGELRFTGSDTVVHWSVIWTLSDGRKFDGKSGDITIQPKGHVGLDASSKIKVTFD
ncbi:hypothetical protein GCM10010170_007550 [Dactylosporangium salmoneum]|uniref:Uncharacterized protein n=1 Tax=Dactylosporangium salmoneum TaxID=53361 RepID=A0ABN3FGN3_9ACTN